LNYSTDCHNLIIRIPQLLCLDATISESLQLDTFTAKLDGGTQAISRIFKDFPRINRQLLGSNTEVKKVGRQKRFAIVELDQIKHVIGQTQEDEPDGADTTVASKPVTAAERSRPKGSKRRGNTKDNQVSKRV
jgi:hypothetical protein